MVKVDGFQTTLHTLSQWGKGLIEKGGGKPEQPRHWKMMLRQDSLPRKLATYRLLVEQLVIHRYALVV
jgi:hypothetical protein